jgi:GABA(A) receptor-associated protein
MLTIPYQFVFFPSSFILLFPSYSLHRTKMTTSENGHSLKLSVPFLVAPHTRTFFHPPSFPRLITMSANQLPVAIECNDGRMLFINVSRDATIAGLEDQVRAALSSKKLSLIIDGCTPAAKTMLRDIHESCKSADGFLYVAVRAEQMMGGCFGCGGQFRGDLK